MNKRLCALVLVVASIQPVWAETQQDPYEGYNRFMFRVNDGLDRHVMVPVAKGYRKITPSPVRTGVRNFFNNLRDVVSFGSNLLRLDIEKASTDLVRVGVNSTFGLGGLIDIAGAGQMPDNKNTLGDTFASWGWKNSHYFVYPLTGPSTVRDSVGSTLVAAYPLKNALLQEPAARYGTTALDALQRRESLLDLTESLNDAALDRYAYIRDVYMNVRNRQVGNAAALPNDDIDIDDLVPDTETPADRLPDNTAATAARTESAAMAPPDPDAASLATAQEKYMHYWPTESVQ